MLSPSRSASTCAKLPDEAIHVKWRPRWSSGVEVHCRKAITQIREASSRPSRGQGCAVPHTRSAWSA